MKYNYFYGQYFKIKYMIFILLFFNYACDSENCLMKRHNFYLIALPKEEPSEKLSGLYKYDYNLILETDPLNQDDNYHMMFSVSFPINVNIELSPEIIYKFESKRRFCIRDLIREKNGRQNNINGKLSEYNSEIQILQNIWIKIEKVLLFKEMELYERKNKFFLLTNLNEKDINQKKYIFMKKMSKSVENQFFQIIRVNLNNKLEGEDCKNEENQSVLKIGTEFTVQEINSGDDSMLREGITYETFASDEAEVKSYRFENIENLVCLNYIDQKYEYKCFSNSNNKLNIINLINKSNIKSDIGIEIK